MVRALVIITILVVALRIYLYQKESTRNPRGKKLDLSNVDLPFLSKRSAKRRIFLKATFGMLAYMAGADRKVTMEEIEALDELTKNKLKLSKEGQRRAVKFFKRAKHSGVPFSYYLDLMKKHFGSNKEILVTQIYILLDIALADNIFTANEKEIVNRAVEAFDLTDIRFQFPYLGGEVEFVYEPFPRLKPRGSKPKSSEIPKDSYKLLGCKPTDSIERIRSAYKLLSEKFDSEALKEKGLPEEFITIAEKKETAIKQAYEEISQYRKKAS